MGFQVGAPFHWSDLVMRSWLTVVSVLDWYEQLSGCTWAGQVTVVLPSLVVVDTWVVLRAEKKTQEGDACVPPQNKRK